MLQVLDEGRDRIFAPPARTWSGSWTMVIYQLSESERAERNQLRKSLSWHGFGPLTTSTWLAPGDRRAEVRALVDELAREQADILKCESEGPEHDRDMAMRCWDLETLGKDYQRFSESHADLLTSAPELKGAEALRARTELIATFRHFPFRDPRLPADLRPDPWPGDPAHELFRSAYDVLGESARAHVSRLVGEVVPPPE
jgi:phenylacetic acid degradation operon negative regulatory protein